MVMIVLSHFLPHVTVEKFEKSWLSVWWEDSVQ